MKNSIKKAMLKQKEIAGRVIDKTIPWVSVGPNWHQWGEFYTFSLGGFASAQSRPELIARHNVEVHHLREHLSSHPTKFSLEIGCGWGRFSRVINQYSERHVGVDINPEAVHIAEKHLPSTHNIASATQLPFSDDSFDTIVSWTVLQHLPHQHFEAALKEIRRVASDESMIVLCEATRYPHTVDGHTIDRKSDEYISAFKDYELIESGYMNEIDDMPDMESPGEIMVFKTN